MFQDIYNGVCFIKLLNSRSHTHIKIPQRICFCNCIAGTLCSVVCDNAWQFQVHYGTESLQNDLNKFHLQYKTIHTVLINSILLYNKWKPIFHFFFAKWITAVSINYVLQILTTKWIPASLHNPKHWFLSHIQSQLKQVYILEFF